ncbi:MAG TPA: hypothetical protein VJZ26_14010 [Blastocatellia bacterium]|nr:hypothetical protein [Blastocatellia bacterium]
MNNLVVAFLTVALITVSAHSRPANRQLTQSKCNLTEANSPNIRGIRLGMSTQQLLALFPGSADRKEIRDALESAKAPASNETARLYFEPATYASRDRFAQVDSVSVNVYKGRVSDFTVVYIGATWRNIDEWIGKLSEAFALPGAQGWVSGPSENPNKILKCDGLEIEAGIGGGSASIRISNARNAKEIEDRINAEMEKKRREFKP